MVSIYLVDIKDFEKSFGKLRTTLRTMPSRMRSFEWKINRKFVIIESRITGSI